MGSRIVVTRGQQHDSQIPYRTMLAHVAGVTLIAALVAACSSAGGAAEPPRYRAAVFTDVAVERGLVYRTDPQLRLDLYEPAGDTASARPAVVWVHGGGFAGGDRSTSVTPFPLELAKSGYVVVSIDYRQAAPSPCVAMAHLSDPCRTALAEAADDADAAVRWLHAHAGDYRIDGTRVAIAGESAGGLTAAAVGTRRGLDAVRAWVSISGGIDDVAAVGRRSAPALLFAATGDPLVPYAWSLAADAALRRAGVRSTLVTLDGDGHVPADATGRFVEESRAFLYDVLDLG